MSAFKKRYDARRLRDVATDLEFAIAGFGNAYPSPPNKDFRPRVGGLKALKRDLDFESLTQAHRSDRHAWVEQVKRAEQIIGAPGSAVSSMFARIELDALLTTCDRQRKPGGAFADPLLRHWFLLAVVCSLDNFEFWGKRSVNRKSPSKSDWLSACKAVDALVRLVRRGAPLGATAIRQGISGISEDSLVKLSAACAVERALAPKPHNDRYSAQRSACREFAKYVYIFFSANVPPSWVEAFGKLIGYQSEKIQRVYVKQWSKEFERVIPLKRDPPPATLTR